jgi:hypothetical protein
MPHHLNVAVRKVMVVSLPIPAIFMVSETCFVSMHQYAEDVTA